MSVSTAAFVRVAATVLGAKREQLAQVARSSFSTDSSFRSLPILLVVSCVSIIMASYPFYEWMMFALPQLVSVA